MFFNFLNFSIYIIDQNYNINFVDYFKIHKQILKLYIISYSYVQEVQHTIDKLNKYI